MPWYGKGFNDSDEEWDYNWISKDVKVYSTAIVREDATINKVIIKE